MPNRTAAILSTALAPLIWGSTYLVTTEFLPPNRPFTAALIRVLPAGLLLLAWTRRLPRRGEWGIVALLGFFEHRLFSGHAVCGGVPFAGRFGGGAEFHADADGASVHLADWQNHAAESGLGLGGGGRGGNCAVGAVAAGALRHAGHFSGTGGRGGDGLGRVFVETPPHFTARAGVHRLAAVYRRTVPAARRPVGRTAAGSVKRGQYRRLSVFVPVWRGVGLCAVVRRHRQTAASRRVVAGIAQPRLRLRAGLAVSRPGHGREIDRRLCVGAGFDFRGAAGGGKGWLKA